MWKELLAWVIIIGTLALLGIGLVTILDDATGKAEKEVFDADETGLFEDDCE